MSIPARIPRHSLPKHISCRFYRTPLTFLLEHTHTDSTPRTIALPQYILPAHSSHSLTHGARTTAATQLWQHHTHPASRPDRCVHTVPVQRRHRNEAPRGEVPDPPTSRAPALRQRAHAIPHGRAHAYPLPPEQLLQSLERSISFADESATQAAPAVVLIDSGEQRGTRQAHPRETAYHPILHTLATEERLHENLRATRCITIHKAADPRAHRHVWVSAAPSVSLHLNLDGDEGSIEGGGIGSGGVEA
ncbi:hypothetical protein B0H13DRAFT_2651836 [Mycena leptocephala]|nr:hypothetical protein B0H13DRAFT_2651836 [Mycena leptocephala]